MSKMIFPISGKLERGYLEKSRIVKTGEIYAKSAQQTLSGAVK